MEGCVAVDVALAWVGAVVEEEADAGGGAGAGGAEEGEYFGVELAEAGRAEERSPASGGEELAGALVIS